MNVKFTKENVLGGTLPEFPVAGTGFSGEAGASKHGYGAVHYVGGDPNTPPGGGSGSGSNTGGSGNGGGSNTNTHTNTHTNTETVTERPRTGIRLNDDGTLDL